MVAEVFAASLCSNSVSAKDLFADNVSTRSQFLDSVLRFMKHAPPLELF